jgi:isoleucyl-tRNA synthetase
MLAPLTPMLSEAFYKSLIKPTKPNPPESIHMCQWPTVTEKWIDKELEGKMDYAREIVETTLAIRQEAKVKLRWPCRRLIIVPKEKSLDITDLLHVIKDQASVKEIQILRRLKEEEKTENLKEKETSQSTVYLDISTTEELESERLTKDFIRRVQSLRKKYGYHVSEKIELIIASANKQIIEGLETQEDQIKNKIGAVKIDKLGKMPEKLPDYDAQDEFEYSGTKIQVAFKRKN